ncbi:MAG: PspC domain-containing protein, partial [Trueperaceae bacterium]|nr:PspC domain-containing protein [Trueperaceae bacterium]
MSRDVLPHDQRRARRPGGTDARLTRSRDDRRIAGIAGGVAAFTGARSSRVRLLFALVLPLSLGIAVIGYLLLWALLPAAPDAPPP